LKIIKHHSAFMALSICLDERKRERESERERELVSVPALILMMKK